MKKILCLLSLLLMLVACTSNEDSKTIKVSCTAVPHAEILEFAKPILEEKGYNLDIEILDNYFIFNEALNNGDVDANFFQHIPFFEEELTSKGYDLVSAGGVHIEPFGFYSKKYQSIAEVNQNAKVIISNSIADHGRILYILQDVGLIKLADGVDQMSATLNDIIENPKNLSFEEVNPEFLTTTYNNDEGDLVAINGNYAIGAGLNPVEDALILEKANNENPYVNIVAVKNGQQDSEKTKVLMEVLLSEQTKEYIINKYQGAVIPVE